MNKASDILKKAFDNSNNRLTKPRKQILDVILNFKEHITVNDIFKKLKNEGIGLATIYRNIDLFNEIGIIKETIIEDVCYYEIKFSKCNKKEFHVHISCNNCNDIIDLKNQKIKSSLDDIYFNIQKKYDFIIKDMSFVFKGNCKCCDEEKYKTSSN